MPRDPNKKARDMRNAIDMIEGALMGAGVIAFGWYFRRKTKKEKRKTKFKKN